MSSNSLSDSFKTQSELTTLGKTILYILLSSLGGTIKPLLVKEQYTNTHDYLMNISKMYQYKIGNHFDFSRASHSF